MMLYVSTKLSGNYTVTDLNDIYSVRFRAAALIDPMGGQARLWLTAVTFPSLAANGLFGHRRFLVLLGMSGHYIPMDPWFLDQGAPDATSSTTAAREGTEAEIDHG